MVAGEKIETREERIPLWKLKLDPTNVRFSHLPGPLSDKELEDEIWKENETRDLMKSIQAAKGLIEPPFVMEGDGYYIIKEGNRRVVALRKLKEAVDNGEIDDFPASYFDKIPCEIIPKKIDPIRMDIMLAVWHVSGKKEWDALNKASHIFKMHRDKGLTYDIIAEYIGVSKSTIKRALLAYEECQRFLKKYPNDPVGIKRFTYFDEFFKKSYLVQKATVDRSFRDKFMEWLAAGKFRTHRDVRVLPDILEDTDATKELEKGTIEDALNTLYRKYPDRGDPLWETIASAVEVLRSMPRSEVKAILEDQAKRHLFSNLVSEVDTLKAELNRIRNGRSSKLK
ncbi:MAG: ParB N-terminal domain-containing protein [Candidatus Hadarchaeum sp.]